MNINDIILPVHILVLVFVAWQVIQADQLGFEWIRGKVHTLDEAKVAKYHRNTWVGLGGMIMTGLIMFWPLREFLLSRPQFYVKMGFVLALVINGLVIGRLQKVATSRGYNELNFKEKLPLIISGGVSTLGWIGATIGGFFLIPD